MYRMTPDQIHSFLQEHPHTAKLATVRSDGRPHIAPVWFDLDGEMLVFTTWHATVKAANIRRDPRVCLCIDEETPPFTYVMIEGNATLSDDPDELLRWTTRIAARYMGQDKSIAYGQRNAVPGELLVHVQPTRIIAQANIAD